MGTGSELSSCSRWGYPGCGGGVSDDDEWQAGSRQRRDEFRRVQGLWSLRGGLSAQGAEPGRRVESLWLPPGHLSGQRLHRLRDLLLRLPGARRNSGAAPRTGTGCGLSEPKGEKTMKPQLTKGNEAIVKAAVLAGCRAYYGYPITPASEIAEAAALYLPPVGGVFIQAESETASVNMLYGGAAAGVRVLSGSSGPGMSLMQEGMSYLAGAELPCVIADIMRGGPGLGNIAPEQGDYNQIVKGGGHGNYRTLVVAPDSVQEMADLTTWAFDLADRYRNPVVVLADGFIGQMMEPVEFAARATVPPA